MLEFLYPIFIKQISDNITIKQYNYIIINLLKNWEVCKCEICDIKGRLFSIFQSSEVTCS